MINSSSYPTDRAIVYAASFDFTGTTTNGNGNVANYHISGAISVILAYSGFNVIYSPVSDPSIAGVSYLTVSGSGTLKTDPNNAKPFGSTGSGTVSGLVGNLGSFNIRTGSNISGGDTIFIGEGYFNTLTNSNSIYDLTTLHVTLEVNDPAFRPYTYDLDPSSVTSLLNMHAVVHQDISGDGAADVVWYSSNNAGVGYWTIGSNSVAHWTDLGVGSTTMKVVGSGDFSNDGRTDILWLNPANGIVGEWLMDSGTPVWRQIGQGSTTMNIAGVGDFNGDGASDILWQNPANGYVGLWEMSGNTPNWVGLGYGSSTVTIAGVGDFNGDGTTDILWLNPANNTVGEWLMKNNSPTWTVAGQGSTTMQIVGVGDFNGDGTDDVLWENLANGTVGYWAMTNGQATAFTVLSTATTTYQVAGIGDYYGNGVDDILWRNPSTGSTGVWAINNNQVTWHDFGIASTAFTTVK